MKLTKSKINPILSPNPKNEWEARCVLNPAVIYDDKREKFVMLYRTAGNDKRHQIVFGLAESDDGVHFTRMSDEPIFRPNCNEPEGGCVEDPRLTKLGDLYYLTYAAHAYAPGQYWLEPYIEGVTKPPMYLDETDVRGEVLPFLAETNITASYLAFTKDFRTYKKLGRVTEATVDDRDVVLFPQVINGKYVFITRPKFKNVPEIKMPSIWISFRDDLLEYVKPELLITGKEWWETQRIGIGTVPMLTKYGWFVLYHGVDDQGIYRVGALILDKENPKTVLARTKNFIMEPDQPFELEGIYNGCVFPTATVLKDGTLYVYYGCADKYVGLATANFDELIEYLWTECKEN